jgi:hypothetical protein
MVLKFDIEKAIQAAAYLIRKTGESDSMFYVVKKLYYADRTALITWGNSITGDRLASLEKGPGVSGIYNLITGKGSPAD